MKQRNERKEEAKTRKTAYGKLTIDQKIEKLDVKFGKGIGAKKARKKLLLAKQKSKKKEVV